jgi:hypothetical protein
MAHNFTPNESASFISLADQIKSALASIDQSDQSNKTEIVNQARYARMLLTDGVLKELDERNKRIAAELPKALESLQNLTTNDFKSGISMINDLLSEAISARIDPDQLNNKTVQALAFATDVNTILDDYNSAFNSTTTQMTDNMNMNMSMNADKMSYMTTVTKEEEIKNIDAFQRALALTNIAVDRYNAQLKDASNNTSAIGKATEGLDRLIVSIENKEDPSKVMGIIHGQIHPNLQIGFNLKLDQEVKQPAGNMSA